MATWTSTETVILPQGTHRETWISAYEAMRESIPEPGYEHYWASWPEGNVTAETFEELADIADRQGRPNWRMHGVVKGEDLKLVITIDLKDRTSDIEVEGQDGALVFRVAHELRERVGDQRVAGAEARGLRRWMSSPNPWVLIIGGTVIGGVIVGLLTNWFGLG